MAVDRRGRRYVLRHGALDLAAAQRLSNCALSEGHAGRGPLDHHGARHDAAASIDLGPADPLPADPAPAESAAVPNPSMYLPAVAGHLAEPLLAALLSGAREVALMPWMALA